MAFWRKSSPELVALFDQTLDAFPDVDKRKMFGYPCAFSNSNLFTGLHQEKWIIRLKKEDRQELISQFGAQSFEPMPGKEMNEYLILPQAVIDSPWQLQEWLQKSIAYVQSLPPTDLKTSKKPE